MVRGSVLVVVVLALACAGCGSSTGLSNSARQAFLNNIYSQAPGIGAKRTGPQLVGMGQGICSDFDAGASVQQVADRVSLQEGSPALSSADLGIVMSAAVGSICPEYRRLLGG